MSVSDVWEIRLNSAIHAKIYLAECLSVRRCISDSNTSLERRQNKAREQRGRSRKDPQLTSRLCSLLSFRGFVGPEGPLVRTFAKLYRALSRHIPPLLPTSYWHHPQFAFLKGAQKPPEIAAGSSDVTAVSISVFLSHLPIISFSLPFFLSILCLPSSRVFSFLLFLSTFFFFHHQRFHE